MAGDMIRWTRATIDLSAIAHNIGELKRVTLPGSELMAVVKADGYGHGAIPVARTCLEAGATRLAVAIVEEGIELRQAGFDVPILVLGAIDPDRAHDIVKYDLTSSLFTPELAVALNAAAGDLGKRAKVHLKVETGMGRIGLPPGDALKSLCRFCCDLKGLEVEGVFSHLALADAADKTYAAYQRQNFEQALSDIAAAGVRPNYRHLANSAATIEMQDYHYELVRPGISIYGYFPSQEVKREIDLRPALSWTTRIAWLKQVPAGSAIGYGCTYRTGDTTRIATLPLGYADGYPRLLSNRGTVLVHGQRAPIVGRICMDQIMIDVGQIAGVSIGDEVTLIGRQGDASITADDLATTIGTISYEILTNVGKRVPRVYHR